MEREPRLSRVRFRPLLTADPPGLVLRSLSQSALRREEAAPGDWGHFALARAGVTRWRRRRSDRGPSGREPAAVVAAVYHRPNSPRPFSSPRRRRGSEAVAAARTPVAQPGSRENPA